MKYTNISCYTDMLGVPVGHRKGSRHPITQGNIYTEMSGINHTHFPGYIDILGMPLGYGQGSRQSLNQVSSE